jgi:hypothetical protein
MPAQRELRYGYRHAENTEKVETLDAISRRPYPENCLTSAPRYSYTRVLLPTPLSTTHTNRKAAEEKISYLYFDNDRDRKVKPTSNIFTNQLPL